MNKKFILLQVSSDTDEKTSTQLNTWIIDTFDNPYEATNRMNNFIKQRFSELMDLDGVMDIAFRRCYRVFAFSCCQINFNFKNTQSIEYYAVMELKEKE